MFLLLTTLLGGVILYYLWQFTYKKLNYWEDRGFPHFDDGIMKPFYDLKNLIFPKQNFEELFIELYRKGKGDRFAGGLFLLYPSIILCDTEVIYNVLIKDFSHFCDRKFPLDEERDPLSAHLFALRGDRWRGLRYKLAPTFTSGKLKSMFEQIADCSEEIVTYIEEKNAGTIEVKELMNSFMLNVIGSVAFGMKVDAHIDKEGEKKEFVELAQKFFKPSPFQFLKFIAIMLCPKLSKLLGINLVEKKVNDFFVNVVKDTVKYRKDTGTKRNDFMQLMINIMEKDADNQNQRGTNDLRDEHTDDNDKELLENIENLKGDTSQCKFTENTLAANSFIFISGGSETTANALAFAMYELAVNPHIQSKVQDEIEKVLSEQNFDYSAINSMTYLDQVINETLRKHPPIPNLTRLCVKDYKIPGTEYVIKKDEEVMVPLVALHHDPDLFPNPETFDPDRFQDPNTIKKGSYMPFGSGPRFCIAMRFALLGVKVCLAKTLRKYNLKLSPKTKLPLTLSKNTFAKNVEGGVWIEFESRN